MFGVNLALAVRSFHAIVLNPTDPADAVVVLRAEGFVYDGRDAGDPTLDPEEVMDGAVQEKVALLLEPADAITMATRMVDALMVAGYGADLIAFMREHTFAEGL